MKIELAVDLQLRPLVRPMRVLDGEVVQPESLLDLAQQGLVGLVQPDPDEAAIVRRGRTGVVEIDRCNAAPALVEGAIDDHSHLAPLPAPDARLSSTISPQRPTAPGRRARFCTDGGGMSSDRRLAEGTVALVLFALTIPAANWMIGHVGTVCRPQSPCLVPVAPGLMAPSGVLMIGLALVLRDIVQRRLGSRRRSRPSSPARRSPPSWLRRPSWSPRPRPFSCRSWPTSLVYTPLQRRSFVLAVVLSSLVGLVVDSTVFLYLAFGSLDFLLGQIVGKAWMVLLAIPFVWWLRERDRRLGLAPA